MNRILVAITYSTCQHDHENDAEDGANKVHKDIFFRWVKTLWVPSANIPDNFPINSSYEVALALASTIWRKQYKSRVNIMQSCVTVNEKW